MWSEVTQAWKYRSVTANFVRTTLAVRYRRSVLGYTWSVLSPLMKYSIMGIVFDVIGRFSMPNYYGFMFVGSVYFGFLSSVIQSSTIAFISNEHYIKKIYVPKLIFVANGVILELVNFLLVMAAILLLLVATGQLTPSWTWLVFPLTLVPTLLFLTGLASIVAVATLYFRDLQHLVEIALQAVFFLTPILYPASTLAKDPHFAWLLYVNPLYFFISLARDTLVENTVPNLLTAVAGLVGSGLICALGVFTIHRFNNRIIFKL